MTDEEWIRERGAVVDVTPVEIDPPASHVLPSENKDDR